MSQPLNARLDGIYKFTKAGALFDPTPAPTLIEASYPDATALAGLPLALTHIRTGVYTLTGVFAANAVTQVGTYSSFAYTSDATADRGGYDGYEWVDVGINNVTADTDPTIAAIKAKTDLIGGASVTLVSNNLTPGATMHLRRTDSYKVVDGRAFSWTLTGQPSISGGTVTVTLSFGSLSVPLTGSVLSATQPQVEIIASQMTTLPPPTAIGKYVVLCTPTDNDPFSFDGTVQIDA